MAQAWQASEVGYFSRSKGSLAKYDRYSFSWKMSPLSGPEGLMLLADDWPRSGMIVDGILYRLSTWARRTKENGGGCSLTTPTTANKIRSQKFQKGRLPNPAEMAMFPTPTASRRDGLQSHGVNVVGGSLNPQWVEWLMGYPLEWTALKDWAMQWFRCKRERRFVD
jgi:hypothetical protein